MPLIHFPVVRTLALVAAVGAVGVAAVAPAYAAGPSTISVTPSDIDASHAAGGGWYADVDAGHDTGVVNIATRAVGEDPALSLYLAHDDDNATLQYRFLPADMPTDSSADGFSTIRQLLSDASFTYLGSSVNFQLGVYYKPTDPSTYGPSGTSPCRSAGIDSPSTWCFTTMKYEPAATTTTYVTQDVSSTFSDGLTGLSSPGGWWRSQQVGQYPVAGSPDGVSLDDMLGQMSDVVVYGIGVSIGKDRAGDTAWVKDLTFGGSHYNFRPDSAPSTAPGLPDESALDSYVDSHGVTQDFEPTPDPAGGPSNPDLGSVDPEKPLFGQLTWSGVGDDYVDVYAYSTPTFVGTFPVVGGKVVISGAGLSFLTAGGHHLVFVGQQSGSVLVAPITVLTALASTGVDAAPALLVAAILSVAGVIALLLSLFVLARRNGAHSA